jgi:hypothetical protein
MRFDIIANLYEAHYQKRRLFMPSEAFRAKAALLLSEDNIYISKALSQDGNQEKEPSKRQDLSLRVKIAAKKIYGIQYRRILSWATENEDGAHMATVAKAFEGEKSKIPKMYAAFKKEAEEKGEAIFGKLTENDMHVNDASIHSLRKFAIKVGMIKCNPDGSFVKTINGNFEADSEKISRAMDSCSHLLSKKNCGLYLTSTDSDKIIDANKGVYSVVFPVPGPNYGKPLYMLAGIRVQHSTGIHGVKSDTKMARLKINVPNMNNDDFHARFQYRGSLKPLGTDKGVDHAQHWSVLFHLVPKTIEKEMFLDAADWVGEDTITLLAQRPRIDGLFHGFLTTISQLNDTGDEVISYTSKVCIRKQFEYDDDLGMQFMRKGIGYSHSLKDLCSDLPHDQEGIVEFYNDLLISGDDSLMVLGR